MSRRTTVRRTASGLGASAIIALAVVAPAAARPEPGPTPATAGSAATWSAPAYGKAGPPAYNTWPHGAGSGVQHGNPDAGSTAGAALSDAVEYAQIGMGAVGGALLASAGALALGARQRNRATVHA